MTRRHGDQGRPRYAAGRWYSWQVDPACSTPGYLHGRRTAGPRRLRRSPLIGLPAYTVRRAVIALSDALRLMSRIRPGLAGVPFN
jgi:hypothetical protein